MACSTCSGISRTCLRCPERTSRRHPCHVQVELPADLKGFDADSDVLPHPKLLEGAGALEERGLALPSDLHSLEQASWAEPGRPADGSL